MPPPPLLADHYYHIYNRGINSGTVFFEERTSVFSETVQPAYFSDCQNLRLLPDEKTIFIFCFLRMGGVVLPYIRYVPKKLEPKNVYANF